MKKVGLKIVLPIVISMTLILITLVLLATVVMPKSLDNQARDAIALEYKYGDDERAKKNLLSANVGYVEVDQLDEELVYLTDTEKVLLLWYKNKSVEVGKFYNVKTSGKNIIFAVYASSDDINDAYRYILYVDTSAINKYVSTLIWIFSSVIALIGLVGSIIGLRVGKSIETAQEIRQSFFQNASHELKTPLMSIQGYAEGIQTKVLDVKKSVGVILEETDRMTTLVEELLTLSKIDSAQAKPNFNLVDIRDILQSAIESFKPIFERENIALRVDEIDKPLMVSCDENQIRKVFTNLLSNALRHAKNIVKLQYKLENNKILISISDDGGGINEDDLPHIFERFYTGKKGNTGIGLTLSKEIIKLHNGDIRATNDNYGAIFQVVLPTKRQNKNKR